MKKVAVLYIALGRYVSFWKGFYESCEKYLGACEKEYFILTNNDVFDYSDAKNVHSTRAQKKKIKYVNPIEMAMIKIVSRHKGHPKYGGVRWLRGQSERKIPNNWFIRNVMIPGCKVVSVFIPSKKYRNKVKKYFGSI